MYKTKQPGIYFNKIFLKELSFERKPEMPDSHNIDINFGINISIAPNKQEMSCELICDVADTEKLFVLHSSMVGLFSCIEGQNNMELERFAESNAPALMLPYIRELVMTTSVRAGLPPINFPPINVRAMLKDKNTKLTATTSSSV